MGRQRNIFLMCSTLAIFHLVNGFSFKDGQKATEDEALAYIQQLDGRYSTECNLEKQARWTYHTNTTEESEMAAGVAAARFERFRSQIQLEILETFPNWKEFESSSLKRQFQYYSIQGPATMVPQEYESMKEIRLRMEAGYTTTRVCQYQNPNNCEMTLADVNSKLNTVTNYEELSYYWTAFHDAVGSNVDTVDYTSFAQLQNHMARLNYFNDMSEMVLANFNDGSGAWSTKDFKQSVLQIWEQLQPYYNIVHAHIRSKLRQNPEYRDNIEPTGSIPANILKNMWSQDWTALYSTTKPFPNATTIMDSGTLAMLDAGYTVYRIFNESDRFFRELGMLPMTDSFWTNSMMTQPEDRNVICVPPFEWDMCLGKGSDDVRIKLCGVVDMDYLGIIHHEMGHMEYFLQYINEDYIFRDGANPGFHEGIGNAIPLAILTPKHMECSLGLDLGLNVDCQAAPWSGQPVSAGDINYLYQLALEKFPFYGLTMSMEAWRWEIFEEKLAESEYNNRWWELKRRFQGVIPPTSRSDSQGFDPASKSQIVTNSDYFRYFMSYIIQFQFYETMCRIAGEYDPDNIESKPLYQCDFSGNQEVGRQFGDMLKSGFSKPWPELLRNFTGSATMSIQPLLNYFTPLFDHILQELVAAGERPCFDEWC